MFEKYVNKNNCIGVQCNESKAKIVSITKKGEEYHLTNLQADDIDKSKLEVIKKASNSPITTILNVCKAIISPSITVSCVVGGSVFSKLFKITPKASDEQIRQKATSIIGDAFDEKEQIYCEYSKLNNDEYVAIATRKNNVDSVSNKIKALSMSANIIEVDYNALARLILFSTRNENLDLENKTYAIVNVDSSKVSFVVISNGFAVYIRNDSHQLQKKFIEILSDESREEFDAELVDDIYLVIKKILQFYLSNSLADDVDHYFICGNPKLLGNIDEVIHEQLGVNFQVVDPLKEFNISNDANIGVVINNPCSWAVCFGLALRGVYSC